MGSRQVSKQQGPLALSRKRRGNIFREIALPAKERGDVWYWTIRLKALLAELIGIISLRKSEQEHRGFWLDPRWHGSGYMTEACDAVTDFWFDVLNFPCCV